MPDSERIMTWLVRIYGWPHEALHVVALWLIGRRAVSITQTHVDIPDDLSTGQYVFVAGFPALVFWGLTVICARGLFAAADVGGMILWLILSAICILAALSTVGDLLLILARLIEARNPPPPGA